MPRGEIYSQAAVPRLLEVFLGQLRTWHWVAMNNLWSGWSWVDYSLGGLKDPGTIKPTSEFLQNRGQVNEPRRFLQRHNSIAPNYTGTAPQACSRFLTVGEISNKRKDADVFHRTPQRWHYLKSKQASSVLMQYPLRLNIITHNGLQTAWREVQFLQAWLHLANILWIDIHFRSINNSWFQSSRADGRQWKNHRRWCRKN